MKATKRNTGSMVVRVTAAVTWLSFVLVTPAWAGLEQQFREMTDTQRHTLMKAFAYGAPHDLGYTLAAIAWQESQAGSVPVNVNDPSFGPFHNKIDTVMKRTYMRDTQYNRNLVATRLLNDFEFAASMALEELLYWKKVHDGKWRNMIRSYNAGYSYASKTAESYMQKIVRKVRAIKRGFQRQGDEFNMHLKYLEAHFSRGGARPIGERMTSRALIPVRLTSNVGM